MFSNTTPLAEIVVRVVVVYTALLVMVRIAGKREIGQLGPIDLLGMLILSEAVSPALTASDDSLIAALVAAGTLLGMAALMGRLTYASRTLERLIDGSPRDVIKGGEIDRGVCSSERISDQELATALRQQGVRSIEDVECATVEPTGVISVVKRRQDA